MSRSFFTMAVLLTVILLQAAPRACAATVPADLIALEQQMAQLQVNSERFSFQEELAFGGGLLGQGTPLILILDGDGEASDSPQQVTVVGGLLGLPQEQIRVIGSTRYSYRPNAREIDGGRPWVRTQHAVKQETQGLDPGGILEADQAGKQGTFSKLIEELNGALSIEQSGPATVDEQRTIEFNAALNPAPLIAQAKARSNESKTSLNSTLETSPVAPKAPAKPAAPPTLELEVFIAPNGLPIRVRLTFAAEGTTVALRVDTLATNIPVHVVPPSAAQTIDEAQLKQLERRRAAREVKRALRACKRLHGKSARQCRALAKVKSRVPRSEATLL